MIDIRSLGAFGIHPFLTEEVLKQKRLEEIKTTAGKMAYILAMGKKPGKPRLEKGVKEARGALKWIAEILEEDKNDQG
jgi:hypothetical protein